MRGFRFYRSNPTLPEITILASQTNTSTFNIITKTFFNNDFHEAFVRGLLFTSHIIEREYNYESEIYLGNATMPNRIYPGTEIYPQRGNLLPMGHLKYTQSGQDYISRLTAILGFTKHQDFLCHVTFYIPQILANILQCNQAVHEVTNKGLIVQHDIFDTKFNPTGKFEYEHKK